METATILQNLLDQSLLAGLLGFFLYKIWEAYQEEKKKKDTLAEAVVKITMLWEERYSKETQDDQEIRLFMQEIRDFVKEIRDGK
jgi:cbb3-type cytochrome oxidase subunit 3